jgi:plastocyanin
MDGFTPKTLDAKPGQTLTLVWSNKDDAAMLTNGVHTLVSDSLKVRLEDPAESTVTVYLAAPMTPGDYDFWCDSCCGGKDTPAMHGTLHVEA